LLHHTPGRENGGYSTLPLGPHLQKASLMTEIFLPSGQTAVSEPVAELRTFLIADIRGYTRFTQDRGDAAAARLITKFARLMREGVNARGGQVIEVVGDEAVAVFSSARQALRAAVDLQSHFAQETETDPELPLPVGIGVDAGEAVPLEGGYRGDALNLASRLCNLASPGEVLASEGVVWLGRRLQGLSFSERGTIPLKGFVDPVRVIRVVREAVPAAPATVSLTPDECAARHDAELPLGGFLGALPPGVLVGRETEWEQIMAALENVTRGTGSLVLLSGEPGIGKTRLAQEVTVKAQHWHFLVATGRCYEQEQSVPYYPFAEALAAVYNACSPELRIDVPRRWPYLSRLLPDLLGTSSFQASSSSAVEEEDQVRLFRSVTQLLVAVAEERPVALLLDDLHWADDSSLKLLAHIARNTRAARVFLLGTYRDVEVNRQHPVERALLDLGREGLVQEISVERLSHDGTAALMAEIMGEEEDLSDLVELVYRRTAGNAFFIQEMLRALVERGDLYKKDGRWERKRIHDMEVPKSIRSVIGQRLSRIEEQAQEVLREASVFGQEFAFEDLMSLVDLTKLRGLEHDGPRAEDVVDSALEQAIAAGLVRETKPEHYAFNHALTQQALYFELSTRRRKRLHLAAGKSLEKLPANARKRRAGELAWHFLEGDDPVQALTYALLAGDQAEEVFANREAERHYETALELAREVGDGARELEALEKLASVYGTEARYQLALDLLEEGVRLHQAQSDREGEASLVAQMAHIHYLRNTADDGVARVLPLVEAMESEPSGARATYGLASLWAGLARLYMQSNDADLRLRAATRAVELAREIGDDKLLLSAEVTRADALWSAGQEEEALAVVKGAIPRAESTGDLTTLARALGNTGVYYARKGDFEKDRLYHQRALEVAERRGDRFQIMLTSMLLSSNAFSAGRWAEAETYIERAEVSIEPSSDSALKTWPIAARGWLALRRGQLNEAARYAQEALPLAQTDGDWYRLVHRLLAEIELLKGENAAALEWIEPLQQEPGWSDDAAFLATLAWVELRNEHMAEAVEPATLALEKTEGRKSSDDRVLALTVAAMLAGHRGLTDDADQLFDEALAAARSAPLPFQEARALQARGEMLEALGERGEASEQLARSLEIYRRLGASRDAELVQAMIEAPESQATVGGSEDTPASVIAD
jgi:class 3 adenylate cyclase/tetratricopeptide (TPR) repeat protein